MVDRIVEHLGGARRPAAVRIGDPAALREALGGPPPEEPGDLDAAIDTLCEQVLPYMQHGDHPRFFARIGSPSNSVGVLADALGAGFNVFAGSWAGGSGPATVELVVLDWLRDWCGLPAGTEGILVSGGSVATLDRAGGARARLGGARRPTRSPTSPTRRTPRCCAALRLLGLARRAACWPPTTPSACRRQTLRAAIDGDRAAGRRPFCVVATAGTTNTGAVDPLAELAAVCAEHGLWLHVDGAYGAPAVADRRRPRALAGLERADSLVLDPHKWLFQPYEIGCAARARRRARSSARSRSSPEYLRDVGRRRRSTSATAAVQLTRGAARAEAVAVGPRRSALAAFRDAIARGIALAEHAEAALERRRRLGGRHARAARRSSRSAATADDAGTALAERDGRRRLRRAELDRAAAAVSCCGCARSTRGRRDEDVEATIERMESSR